MKRFNTAAIALAAAGVAQAFAEAGDKVAGFNDALERQRKENEREEKRARRFVHFEERPKGKGERKRTRGDWSNSRGRKG